MEVLNAILETKDMHTALNNNVDSVFEVYSDIWDWVKSYYDRYKQCPERDKVARQFSEFEHLATSGSLQFYIDEAHRTVSTAKMKEALIEAAKRLQENGPTDAISYISSQATKLVKETGQVKDSDLVLDYWERVEKLEAQVEHTEAGGGVLGVPSTIDPLDFHFGGWNPGDFIVLLGWTGQGKSWLSRLFAVKAWEHGFRPLVISLEMNKYQEGYRFDTILQQGRGFRNSQLSHGRNIDPQEYKEWAQTAFKDKPPFYLVTNEGLDEVNQNMVQAKIEQYNPDLVILDYHGLFDDAQGGRSETEKAKNLSKDFKRMAVRNQVPIIDVAAVTMAEGGQGERPPELHEVAWSKQLAFDADLVLSIYRQQDSQMFEVCARKNRRGDLFAFNLAWDLDTGQIEPIYV